MSEFRIASRYAKSLLQLADEQKLLEEVNKDMLLFTEVIQGNRDFQLMLKNPVIGHEKKLNVLNLVFKGKVNALTLSMFILITKKHREAFLPAIAKEFHHQYNAKKFIEEATVTTMYPIDEKLRAEFMALVKKISGKEVQLTEKLDENLIGGFILKIGDRQIDDSINSRLKALKLKFSQNPYVKVF